MAADDFVTPDGYRIPRTLLTPDQQAALEAQNANSSVASALSDDSLKRTFGDDNLRATFGGGPAKPPLPQDPNSPGNLGNNLAATARDVGGDIYDAATKPMDAVKKAVNGLGMIAEGAGKGTAQIAAATGNPLPNMLPPVAKPPAPGQPPTTGPGPGISLSPQGMALQAAMGNTGVPGDSTSLRASGGTVPTGAGYGGVLREEKSAAGKAMEAEKNLGDIAAQRAAAAQGEQEGKLRALENDEQRRQEIERRAQTIQQDQIGKAQALQDELAKQANVKVDPNHFWADKSNSDKAMASFALFLSGFGSSLTGGENQALSILNRAIDRDVDAQKANWDRANKVQAQRIEGQKNIYGMYLNALGDERAAQAASKASQLEIFNQRIENAKQKFDAPEAKARAEQAQAVIAGQLAKAHKEVTDAINDNAYKMGTLSVQKEEADARMVAARGEAMKAAKGGGGTKLPATDAATLAQLKQGETMLKDLSDAYDKKTGFFSAVASGIPGTPSSRYGNDKLAAAQAIGTVLEGGKLTDSDLKDKYLKLVPDASDSKETKEEKIASLRKILRDKQKANIEGFAKAGYDVSGFADDYAGLANDDKAAQLEAKLQR